MIALVCTEARSATQFTRQFAPQDGLTAPAERPYRSEICLNGKWQFQPVRLSPGFQQGKSSDAILPPGDQQGKSTVAILLPKYPQGESSVPILPPPSAAWDKTPIRIPSPWNANSFADQNGLAGNFRCFPSYPNSWNDVQMGWLRRQFTVPADWKGRRLLLHFEAVAGDAQIVVNGRTVGHHFDIFLPFDVDVTDAVKLGAKTSF